MSEIIFHLGWPKTGSTALQGHLARNKKDLEQAGFYVPPNLYDPLDPDSSKTTELRQYARGRSHSLILHELIGASGRLGQRGLKDTSDLAGAFDNAITAFEASGCKTMILSNEMMFWASQSMVYGHMPKRLANYSLRGLAYARRYDRYFTSLYRQNVKAGNVSERTFSDFIKQRRKERKSGIEKPASHLERYKNLGIEVDLRSYDDVGKNMIRDAMTFFGAPDELCEPVHVPTSANPSFSDAQSIFVLEMNRRVKNKKRVELATTRMRSRNKAGELSIDLPDNNEDMQRAAEFQGKTFQPINTDNIPNKRVAENLTDGEWDTALNSLRKPLRRLLTN